MTKLAFDRLPILESARRVDDNGFMHVAISNLTKEQVAPYLGEEIPDFERLGLKAREIYNVYRPAEELAKPETVESCNGIPIQLKHHEDYADAPAKDTRIGSTGTDGEFKAPYLTNSLHFTDADAINRIKDGSMKELSLGYRYTPVKKHGTFNGEDYDIVMTDISCNHLALVEQGRAGHDVIVKDSKPNLTGDNMDVKELQQANAIAEKVEDLAEKLGEVTENAANGVDQGENAMDSEIMTNFIDELVKAGIDAEKAKATIEDIIKERTAAPAADEEEKAVADEGEEVKAEATDGDLVEEVKAEEEATDEGEEVAVAEEVKAEDEDDQLIKDALKECGLDEEPEEVQKAFAEGVKYGEKLEKAEPEKLDAEHESEGEKKALGEDSAAKILKVVEQSIASRFVAAEECKAHLGKINAMAYDNAGAIYRMACKKMGIATKGLSGNECRAVYKAMASVKARPATMAKDSASVKADPIKAKLSGIKTII